MPAHGRPHRPTETAQAIADAALRLFHEHGYHGTSIRDIAREADVGIATLFHHHENKLELLRKLMDAGYDELLSELEAADRAAQGDPAARLAALVRTLVLRHFRHPLESALVKSEMRSLSGQPREELRSKGERVHGLFASAIADGVASGAFTTGAPREAARAVHAMCAAARSWERGDGERPEELAELYADMALRIAGVRRLTPA